jgi:hypothetical protein
MMERSPAFLMSFFSSSCVFFLLPSFFPSLLSIFPAFLRLFDFHFYLPTKSELEKDDVGEHDPPRAEQDRSGGIRILIGMHCEC